MKKRIRISCIKLELIHVIAAVFLIFLVLTPNIMFYSDSLFTEYAFSAFWGSMYPEQNTTPDGGKLAIIIDDFGQDRSGVKEMMSINRHMTFAVMPFLSFSEFDAENAYTKGFEVIVHLPMESDIGKLSLVGPRPILSALGDMEIQQIVMDSFESVPHALGANIHMGGKAGGDKRVVSDILDMMKLKGLYFVDSRTSKKAVAKGLADEKGVLCFERNIFLDGNRNKEQIKQQLRAAGELALKKGYSIAFGHVGAEGGKKTAEAISEMLPEFDEKNIRLVFVSELKKIDF